MLVVPGTLPRSRAISFTRGGSRKGTGGPFRLSEDDGYSSVMWKLRHSEVGGVTSATCWVTVISRRGHSVSKDSLMTRSAYPRTLQTSLDDTIGRAGRKTPTFEPRTEGSTLPTHAVGTVKFGDGRSQAVYSGKGVGPDLGQLPPGELNFWVLSSSVYSRGVPLLRPVRRHEVLAIWDYEGKLDGQGWNKRQFDWFLRARLASPPAKIVRGILFGACTAELPHQLPVQTVESLVVAGKTADVPFSPLEVRANARMKAAQPDDAEVDLTPWATPDETMAVARARQVLRRLAVRWWIRHQTRVALDWLGAGRRNRKDREGVEDCLRCIRGVTYFGWPRGSRHLFYKVGDPEWRREFRDGIRCWRVGPQPTGAMQNAASPSREAELLARQKVFKLRLKGYMEKKYNSLLTPRFLVPKVVENGVILDVRCVWDCKVNGLNASLWAPGFMLPDSQDAENLVIKWLSRKAGGSLAQYLKEGSPDQDYTLPPKSFVKSKQVDVDVGEHFSNVQLHADDRPLVGIRHIMTNNAPGAVEAEDFYRSTSLPFGLKCSPYIACQSQARITEIVKGDTSSPTNPFHFEKVVLNLPCNSNYDPSLPRVMLLRQDGELATQEETYVDDLHLVGRSAEGDWQVMGADGQVRLATFDLARDAAKQLKSRMNSLGSQADDRKYRPPTYSPGAWRGIIVSTATPFPMISTTGKKWARMKDALGWVLSQGGEGSFIDTAELRRIAGLGVHLTEVYRYGRSYLQGFFNAIEAFRDDRGLDGWRLTDAMEEAAKLEDEDSPRADAQLGYPAATRITAELLMHASALQRMFAADEPLLIPVRPARAENLRYIIGDASAEGFAIATQFPSGRIETKDGLWRADYSEGGSNLREATNHVNYLLSAISNGEHDGCEIWAATDNAVFSAVWHKGMSTAPHLFHLVLKLKMACYEHEVYLPLFHISGDRMISCGIDGGSRGDEEAGIYLGFDMRTFLPLNKGPFELAGTQLEDWCRGWMGSDFAPPLEPVEWFRRGHLPGIHVWGPPPGAALTVLKQLAKSRQKRPKKVCHVFVCQRLLWQEEWRSRFEKEMDVWFILQPGRCWPASFHEPLLVGISFPMNSSTAVGGPWLVRQRREEVVAFGRAMSRLSETCHLQVRDCLRQLWHNPWVLPEVPGRVV